MNLCPFAGMPKLGTGSGSGRGGCGMRKIARLAGDFADLIWSWRVSASVRRVAIAIVRRGDCWLVAQRHQQAHLGGMWEFPGGKSERGETPDQTALRELREECGVEAVVERILPQLRHDYGDRVIELTPVLCRWTRGDAQPLGSVACRWVGAEELRRLEMPAVNAEILRELG